MNFKGKVLGNKNYKNKNISESQPWPSLQRYNASKSLIKTNSLGIT